jgi:ADP-heptose:LPS heptosyltransferase
MKILFLRFSSIGDIVLTSPAIRCARQQINDAEIHYATKKAYYSIVESNPYVDKIHLLGDNLIEFVKELQAEKFDLIIDLHNNQRTFLIKFLLGVKSHSFPKLNFKKWLFTSFKIDKLPDIHIVDRYLEPLKKMGVINDGKGLDYFISDKDEVDVSSEFGFDENKYIAFVIGAKFTTKQLPVEKLASVCNGIKVPVVLLGGPEDIKRAEAIMHLINSKHVINACGKYNLNQSASVVKKAAVVVTHDTGLMHIAAAFQKKIVSIWGNTVPQLGMYPYVSEEKSKMIEVANLKCRPCSKIGHNKCPKGHFDCMQKINDSEVVGAVEQFY